MDDVVDNLKARADAVPVWVKERGVSNYMVSVAREDVLSAIAAIEARDSRIAEMEAENDEAFKLGIEDGRSEMAREIDLATGGDGEYRVCLGFCDPDRHCPDANAMRDRIIERLSALPTSPKGADHGE